MLWHPTFCLALLALVLTTRPWLQPFHVQINARTEDDLDVDTLRDKCERSAGARY